MPWGGRLEPGTNLGDIDTGVSLPPWRPWQCLGYHGKLPKRTAQVPGRKGIVTRARRKHEDPGTRGGGVAACQCRGPRVPICTKKSAVFVDSVHGHDR